MDRIKNHPILGETPKRKKVTFSYDGKLLEGYEGEPIATALKAAGVMAVQTQYGVSAAPQK